MLPREQSNSAGRVGSDERQGIGPPSGGRFCRCGAWWGQLGQEPTVALYVQHLVGIFREVRRLLAPWGTCWLNLGDSYATNNHSAASNGHPTRHQKGSPQRGDEIVERRLGGLKPKDLVGVPWRVALALQEDGWWLRSDIIWHKPNPMPESVRDRPTRAHEYVSLLTKSERYFYDALAVAETASVGARGSRFDQGKTWVTQRRVGKGYRDTALRNLRTVWTIPPEPFPGAHFAVFPTKLAERCVLAGSPAAGVCSICGRPWEPVVERVRSPRGAYAGKPFATGSASERMRGAVAGARAAGGDHDQPFPSPRVTGHRPTCPCAAPARPALVLDPFCGAGSTGVAALRHGRRFLGIDLSADYLAMARERLLRACSP
jgi:DNA modification methylase